MSVTDAVSQVVSYVLKPRLVNFHHQSFYFTTPSMTDDGRFLLFHAAANEFRGGSTRRTNAFIDFATDTISVFTNTSFYSPAVDTECDQIWFIDKSGVHRRDLLVDPQKDNLVCALPPELAYVQGKSYSYGTHATLSPDRTRLFIDARTDQIYRQGCICVTNGVWEEWSQEPFCCNHGQSNPVDGSWGMCAWEYGSYLVTDEVAPDQLANVSMQVAPYVTWLTRGSDYIYPRLWLFRPNEGGWLVKSKITNYATHEMFAPDGQGFLWCSSGVSYHDLATEREKRISPINAAHATMTADGRYLVFDCSMNGWWRGCDWTVRFWDRDAHRSCYIHNFMKRMAEKDNESVLHPDPHPQFVCKDRYVVCTMLTGDEEGPVNDRYMALSVTPVAQLKALTAAMAESNAVKRLEILGWPSAVTNDTPCEIEVSTSAVRSRLSKQKQTLLVPQCTQNGNEFTSYALEVVRGGVTSAVPCEAVQATSDYRYNVILRCSPPADAEKLLLLVDPPGRYEVADSELCANLFDRRDIRTYYPPQAATTTTQGQAVQAAATCNVTQAAGQSVRFELDVRNFHFTALWYGRVCVEQLDAAGKSLGDALDHALTDVCLMPGTRARWRTTGHLHKQAVTARLVFEGVTEDGSAPCLQIQHLNMRPARIIQTDTRATSTTTEKTALVITVPAGTEQTFDAAKYGSVLTSNTATNFIKRGGGTLVVNTNLKSYLGDITVEEGTYCFTTNTALGMLAGEEKCGSVRVCAGAALEARPPKGAHGEVWGLYNKRIFFAGDGPDRRGALIQTGASSIWRAMFSTNLILTADARMGAYGSYILYQNGGGRPISVLMKGHTLTLGGTAPWALGSWNVHWPGHIVIDKGPSAVTIMNPNSTFAGTAANRFSFTGDTALYFNKNAGVIPWTLDATRLKGIMVSDGRAGVNTNISYWHGPVVTGTNLLPVALKAFDLTFYGPVSGAGLNVTGNALTNGRLHLASAANAFTNSLTAQNTDIYVWHPTAIPTASAALVLNNSSLRLMTDDAEYNLPPLTCIGSGEIVGQGAWGTCRTGVYKSGAGTLSWPLLIDADQLDVTGGRVAIGSVSPRAAVAGLIESTRHDYPSIDAETRAMMTALHTVLSVETNIVTLSPAAFYDQYHHLWTDPKPDPPLTSTYRCLFSYSGYLWNNAVTNVTWSFAGAAGTHTHLAINDKRVFYWTNAKTCCVAQATLTPGPNRFDVRTYTTSPGSRAGTRCNWSIPNFMIGYDPLGRGLTNQTAYLKLIDPGDGSLLTWCRPEEVTEGVTVAPGCTRVLVTRPHFTRMTCAPNTALDFAGTDYSVEELTGIPEITGVTNSFAVTAWHVPLDAVAAGAALTLPGALNLGAVILENAAAIGGRTRYRLATAAGKITYGSLHVDEDTGARWMLDVSADGHTLYAVRHPNGTQLQLR